MFSAVASDVIYFGVNLADYFERELTGEYNRPMQDEIKHIPFWSDLVVRSGWITATI